MARRALVTLALLATAVFVAASCSGKDEPRAEQPERTVERPRDLPTPKLQQGENDQGGGLLAALGDLLEDETGPCVDAITTNMGESSGGTVPAVARDVERLRRLRFKQIPRPRYLPPKRLARRLLASLDEAYPKSETVTDERTLIALGVLPEDSDLRALLHRQLSAQVAGFYDPQTGELVVQSDARRSLSGFERLILSHELEHALADQALEFPSYLEADRPTRGTEDTVLAGLALIEGDATLTMEAYALTSLSFLDALRAIGPALAAERQAGEIPHYLEAGMSFPYFDGAEFVCALYRRGGWRGVDQAYARPPTTTAQVMFPNRYFAREGRVRPRAPKSPGPGWRRLATRSIGAADLLWLFEAPGDDKGRALSDARERAAAWAGGEIHVWGRGERTTVALALVERPGERDLCASVRKWLGALVAERGRPGAIRCSGRAVHVAVAPTVRTARVVAGPGSRAVSR